MKCRRCPHPTGTLIKRKGPHIGLYCVDCGSWIKWVPKEGNNPTVTIEMTITPLEPMQGEVISSDEECPF